MRRHYWCAARRGATPPATDGLYEGCRAPPRASLDRYVAAQADSARASCHTEADSGRYYLCRGRRRLASRSSAAVPGRRGKSGTACNCRRRESGGYVPKSRDIRGIGMSFTITPEACSPMNKGPPAFSAERSVKPSAQPTLVRTQHPPPSLSPYISANSASQDCRFLGKGGGPPNRRLSSVRTSDSEVCRKYHGQTRLKGQVARRLVRGGHRPIGARSGVRGIYAGWIMSRYGAGRTPVVDHLSALKGPCWMRSRRSPRRPAPMTRSGGVAAGACQGADTTDAISAAAG
jgi:hypothetical protein